MDFEAYYDSSGRRDQQKATTLAGVVASKHVWEQFNPRWENALDASGVPDRCFGMADLMASHGHFEGWDGARQNQLLTALFNVLAEFRPLGLSTYSCTVFFRAYDAAKDQIPKRLTLEAICVNHCVGGLQMTARWPDTQSLDLYLFFDQDEPFLNPVKQVWNRLKKQRRGWPNQVRDILPVNDSYCGIQAADLLAWIVNRNRCEALARGDPQPASYLSFADALDRQSYLFFHAWMMVNHCMKVYDDASKIVEYGKALESVRNAQRKP